MRAVEEGGVGGAAGFFGEETTGVDFDEVGRCVGGALFGTGAGAFP